MTLGRRYELLMANAARQIPERRRHELIELAMQWMESDACSAESIEEMFYLWGAMTGIQMKAYEQTIQTQIGGEILEKGLSKMSFVGRLSGGSTALEAGRKGGG